MTGPLETKVAASGLTGAAVSLAFAVLHWLAPSVPAPPAVVTGLAVTVLSGMAGWLAPHTHLRPPPPLTPDDLQELARGRVPLEQLVAEEIAALRAGPQSPPATTTGGTQ